MQAASSAPPVIVRGQEPGDDAFIARLAVQAFFEFSASAREHTLGMARELPTFVALRGGERLGFAIVELFGERLELQAIAVLDRERGRGVGHRLLQEVERYARAHGARSVSLRTAEANLAAIDLFRRRGFRVERRLKRYYRNVFDAFVMVKVVGRARSG